MKGKEARIAERMLNAVKDKREAQFVYVHSGTARIYIPVGTATDVKVLCEYVLKATTEGKRKA